MESLHTKERTDTAHNSQPQSHTPSPTPEAKPGFFGELFRIALIALVVVVPIRLFIAQPFIVQGASMEPTFENGEYLIVDQLSYNFETPERGDVIIFRYPRDPSKFFIKRIVGLPGETVTVRGDTVTIVNGDYPEGLVLDESYIRSMHGDEVLTRNLEPDEYFVMGDNRDASSDSRVWGALPEDLIVGRALLRLLPVSKASVLPGHL